MAKKTKSFFIVSIALVAVICIVIAIIIGVLPHIGFFRYYVDGIKTKTNITKAYSRTVLWEFPEKFKGQVNNIHGNRDFTISEDGKTLIIARKYSTDNYDLFISFLKKNEWTKPLKIRNINTEYNELNPDLSIDGRYLIFSSNRPDGMAGGYNIWISEVINNRFSEPVLLSTTINTVYDEKTPSFSNNMNGIYFSSNKPLNYIHSSKDRQPAKDFDIYFSNFDNNMRENYRFIKFAAPENIQAFNSNDDEGKVASNERGNMFYFSSNRENGFGGYDLYRSYLLNRGFTIPQNLGNIVNSNKNEISPCITENNFELYFSSNKNSIYSSNYKFYNTYSIEVVDEIDYSFILDLVFAIIIMLIIILFVWFIIRLLGRNADIKLIIKCLLIAVILHLIFAAISSYWFFSSKIKEKLLEREQITININSLAKENLALAIREGVASLPKIKSVSTTEKPSASMNLPSHKPISTVETSDIWSRTLSKTQSTTKKINKNVYTNYKSNPSLYQKNIKTAEPLKFGTSNIKMEVPDGTGHEASAMKKGSSKGLSGDVSLESIQKKEVNKDKMGSLALAMRPGASDITVSEVNISKVPAKMKNFYISGAAITKNSKPKVMSNDIDGMVDEVTSSNKDKRISGLAFKGGNFKIENDFTMVVPKNSIAIKSFKIGMFNNNYDFFKQKRYYSMIEKNDIITVNLIELTNMILNSKLYITSFSTINVNPDKYFNENVGYIVYSQTKKLKFVIDSEMEVPERYLTN
ncbi:MAG: hypothetical protein GY756_05805 [bacterium]|nr:hypothetical protein [bacterium]